MAKATEIVELAVEGMMWCVEETRVGGCSSGVVEARGPRHLVHAAVLGRGRPWKSRRWKWKVASRALEHEPATSPRACSLSIPRPLAPPALPIPIVTTA